MKNFEDIRKSGDLLFESIRGSHLFGLNTESSDIDTFGVFCGPEEWFLGSGKDLQSFIKSEKSDDYWDELSKYFCELGKSNPEALVSLFTPDKFILHFDPILEPLWDIRDKLLTKECFKSFSGYAYSQIKKAKGLKKAINTDPQEVKDRKTPISFCQVPVGIGTHTLDKWLNDRGLRQECCGISRLPNSNECYSLFYDWGKARELGDNVEIDADTIGFRGILSPDDPLTSQLRLSSIPKNLEPLCWFQFNSNAYTSHCIEYKRYWDWVKNRNEARFQLNSGYNYDCYSLSVTKFLTEDGWKWFGEININEKIGCFDKSGNLKFSKIKGKTCYDLDPGQSIVLNLYMDNLNNINFCVTDNHRMWVRREDWDNYDLVPMYDLKNQLQQGYKYYQLSTIINTIEDCNIPDEQIELLAIIIANGGFITQGNSENFIPTIFWDNYSIDYIQEVLDKSVVAGEYTVDDAIGAIYVNESGFVNEEIHKIILDLYYFNIVTPVNKLLCKFSSRQFNLFINSMSKLSKRTYFKTNNKLFKFRLDLSYYKRTKIFISEFERLCNLHGYEISTYTEKGVNFVNIRYNPIHEVLFKQEFLNSFDCPSDDCRSTVGCFETETGTLVTSGFFDPKIHTESRLGSWGISFHGNSKNISHCVRIFTMAKEIADGKGMILDRTGIDRDFLLSIKNHEKSYDEVMKYVEDLKEEMEESFIKSNLPDSPDLDLLDKIMIDIRRKHYGKNKTSTR